MKFSEIESREEQKDLLEELGSLMKETNELNQLMQSYIRVHMKEDTVLQMTVDGELEKIKKAGQEMQERMISILAKLEIMQKDYAGKLHQLMENGKKEMKESNQKTLIQMSEIEKKLEDNMNEMNGNMKRSLNEIESKTLNLIGETRKAVMINYWLDVVKYGLGTAIFVVPVYMLFKFILGLFGIQAM